MISGALRPIHGGGVLDRKRRQRVQGAGCVGVGGVGGAREVLHVSD